MTEIIKTLQELSTPSSQKEAFDIWLELKDAVAFLTENAGGEEFVVYAGLTAHTFMHAILVPASLVNPPDIEDLMSWNCNASSSWGISHTYSEPPSVYISPPLDEHTGSKILGKGEQLVFARFFDGRLGNKSYFEVFQKVIHVFDLHFLSERNAYCRLNELGDIEDVIRIIEVPGGLDSGGTVVTFNRGLLDDYMVLTDSVVVRTFDFTRFRPSHFSGWSNKQNPKHTTEGDLFYRSVIEPGHASYMRGFQIVRPLTSKEEIIRRLGQFRDKEKQYASFIAYDWKNDVVREISCAPGHTANYFTQSDLPFEVSPTFFRPEVLLKYKSDSEKYQLTDRSVSCRGAWHLKTYDINEAGQVHTYIIYLRSLPYEEQLYWKAYNEHPKGPISKRAYKTDFQGVWDFEYDPLNSLKAAARELIHQQVLWWTARSEKLPHYPVTSSPDEWLNEILVLDQLLIEGFEEKWLRKKVQSLGRTPDPAFGSLKLVEECLIALGFEEDRARKITAPLHEVHNLRKLKAHASGQEATKIKQKLLAKHGSYKEQFRALCSECDDAVRTVTEAFKGLG